MKSELVIAAVGVVLVANAISFHRSFRNGYPSEWHVSKEESEWARPLSQRSVRLGGPSPVDKRELQGMVTRVLDGGTFWLSVPGGGRHKVRLVGLLVPKGAQKGAAESAKCLAEAVSGGPVRVVCTARDPYGSLLGIVWRNDVEVNLLLLREGRARLSPHYKDARYAAAQHAAQIRQIGIWEGWPASRKGRAEKIERDPHSPFEEWKEADNVEKTKRREKESARFR